MPMSAAKKQMSEEQAVNLVRNSLMVAGYEMGEPGDHWPVIKSTVDSIMKDWENIKTERKESAELQKNYLELIDKMEKNIDLCPPDTRPEVEGMIKELREVYEARFGPMDMTMFVVCDADIPIHIKRAEAILKTLEDEDD